MRRFTLIAIFITFFLPAKTQVLHEKVTRQSAQTALAQSYKAQIQKALQLTAFSNPWKTNWEDFLVENAVLQVPESTESIDTLCQQLFDSDCELFTALFLGEQKWQNTRPDYAQETQHVKYIYVADASGHGTKTILQEVTRLLKQIRHARPQARILLALEFAVREDPRALPIHFAQETPWPFTIDPTYASLVKTADKLNMDVLSLDDYIFSNQEPLMFRMGDALVQNLDHPYVQAVLAQYQPQLPEQIAQQEAQCAALTQEMARLSKGLANLEDNPGAVVPRMTPHQLKNAKEQWRGELNQLLQKYLECKQRMQALNQRKILYLHDFISRTPWGMDQRNTQWAHYIQALDPFYDVIITYAGNAHLSLPISGAVILPKRIAQPFVLFDFYTQEQLKQEDAQAYEQLAQIQAQENPGIDWWEDVEQDELLEYCTQYTGEPWAHIGKTTKPFFIKNTYPSAMAAAGQDPQRQIILKKYNADLEFTVPHTDFSVFLPDYSKHCLFK